MPQALDMRDAESSETSPAAIVDGWKLEAPVKKVIAFPAAAGWLVLLHHQSVRGKRFRNLLYVDSNGLELWRAHLPKDTVPDSFVDVKVEGDSIVAWTWSSYRMVLDAHTGETVRVELTK
jgi:hypothetical protein